MSNQFPPDDGDKTIIMPRPGGKKTTPIAHPEPTEIPAPAPPHQAPSPQVAAPAESGNFGASVAQRLSLTGVNSLVSAASPLLALMSQLRTMVAHNNVSSLRQQIISEMRAFENQAQAFGIGSDISYTARYLLCTCLDEIVMNTVWGSSSNWSNQSLLSTLHNETQGGKKFFVILDRLLKDRQANLDLIELMYICISMGFQGQYRVMDRGPERLEELRHIVFEHIRSRRGEFSVDLSPDWQPSVDTRNTLQKQVPLWVIAAVLGVVLLSIFIGFTMVLEDSAAPVHELLDSLGQPQNITTPSEG